MISCTRLNDNSIQGIVITGEQGFGFLAGPRSDAAVYRSPLLAQFVPTIRLKGEFYVTN
ncbi:MAG TPA: hypothetical protein VK117_15795 [Pyrinomonadaceae bacterium]|nr:hypothetical protein [Pyrinomonadaceae bacterium]